MFQFVASLERREGPLENGNFGVHGGKSVRSLLQVRIVVQMEEKKNI